MILGVDASNLRYGGGVTHLQELLAAADPPAQGVSRVVVWGGRATLDRLPERPWLARVHEPTLDGDLARRTAWQQLALPWRSRDAGCTAHFAPGTTAPESLRPRVVMCRNMLPFDEAERARYRGTTGGLRLDALRVAHARALSSADGAIFLTEHARDAVLSRLPKRPRAVAIIPHGVTPRFLRAPRPQRAIEDCTPDAPFRWVYVSTVTRYKHQAKVLDAVRALRAEGLPVALELVGIEEDARSGREVREGLRAWDPDGRWARYRGHVPFAELAEVYARADGALYASSCENMPNILLESMASGLPVACSDRGPMPEVIGDAAVYFDPEDAADIARAARVLLRDPRLRLRLAERAHARAQRFTWGACARATFDFVRAVASGA
ncbi:MAG: glycosyltransferase family 1 protein [Polyangiales bacterium]